jgi:hypothetical protein
VLTAYQTNGAVSTSDLAKYFYAWSTGPFPSPLETVLPGNPEEYTGGATFNLKKLVGQDPTTGLLLAPFTLNLEWNTSAPGFPVSLGYFLFGQTFRNGTHLVDEINPPLRDHGFYQPAWFTIPINQNLTFGDIVAASPTPPP